MKNKIANRQENNIKILDIISEYVENHPDMRFGQILAALNIIEYDHTKLTPEVIDPFFEESVDMYNRIMNKYDPS